MGSVVLEEIVSLCCFRPRSPTFGPNVRWPISNWGLGAVVAASGENELATSGMEIHESYLMRFGETWRKGCRMQSSELLEEGQEHEALRTNGSGCRILR